MFIFGLILKKYVAIMLYSEQTSELDVTKRGPTSINVDLELWKEVKKAAIDEGVTATEFLEEALKDRLAKTKAKK
jgi:ribbon-helix-helix CopG family protein